MPKIGIIYNDIKPIACKTAHQIQDQLLSLGWQVFMATGSGWYSPIGSPAVGHPQFAPVNGQYGTHGLFDRNLPKSA